MSRYLVSLTLTTPDPPSGALTMLTQEFRARSFVAAAAMAQRSMDHWAGRGMYRVSTVERVG